METSPHSKLPQGVVPKTTISMENRSRHDPEAVQRVARFQSNNVVSCKSLYFFLVGILVGTMLGFALNHNRMDTGLWNGNKCIVPCDQLLRDYNVLRTESGPKDLKIHKLAMSRTPVNTETKKEEKPEPEVKLEVPTDIVPIPVGPFEEIENVDNSPSGIGVKFTRLGNGIAIRHYSVGIPDEDPIAIPAMPVALAVAKSSVLKPENSKLTESDTDSKWAESDLTDSDTKEGFFSVFDKFPSVQVSPLGDTFSFQPSSNFPDALTRLLLAGAFIPVEDSEQSKVKDSTGPNQEVIPDDSAGPVELVQEAESPKVPVQVEDVPEPPKELAVQKEQIAEVPVQKEEVPNPSKKELPVQASEASDMGWVQDQKLPGFSLRYDSAGVDIREKAPKLRADNKENPQPTLDLKEDKYEFYFSNTEEKASWSDASKKCAARNMELVSIENPEKQDAIQRSLALVEAPGSLDLFWTSGTNLKSGLVQLEFSWASTGDVFSYYNWNVGQPILPKSENFGCAGMKRIGENKKEYQWFTDVSCFQPSRYICQIPAKIQPRAENNPETVK